MGRSLVQRGPTGCGVSLCVIFKPQKLGGLGRRRAVASEEKKIFCWNLFCCFSQTLAANLFEYSTASEHR
jgi:hypothetical protein